MTREGHTKMQTRKLAFTAVALSISMISLSGCGVTTEAQTPPSSIETETTAIKEEPKVTFHNIELKPYNGEDVVILNNNEPFFTADDYSEFVFESYTELDSLGRCGKAYANIGIEIMPKTEKPDEISIEPSGWKDTEHELYTKLSLIDYNLSGEKTNTKNVITGTKHLNDLMLEYVNKVEKYVKETENHVLYRVTPIFEDNNLVANGVVVEAYSVEDSGKAIKLCVYLYNTQPGVTIDYATGNSYQQ